MSIDDEVIEISDTVREFKGKRYVLAPDGYFMTSNGPMKPNTSLHRDIWESMYGPIPNGHVIHHVDNDTENNSLKNLRIMHRSDHVKLHGQMKSGRPLKYSSIVGDEAKKYHKTYEEECVSNEDKYLAYMKYQAQLLWLFERVFENGDFGDEWAWREIKSITKNIRLCCLKPTRNRYIRMSWLR